MHISDKIKEKYEEMKKSGKTEDFLDEEHFKGLKIFINTEPKSMLFVLEFDRDKVYLGAN